MKGVTYAFCLNAVGEVEIVSEMKWKDITDVYKFAKPNSEEQFRSPTGKIVFSFIYLLFYLATYGNLSANKNDNLEINQISQYNKGNK